MAMTPQEMANLINDKFYYVKVIFATSYTSKEYIYKVPLSIKDLKVDDLVIVKSSIDAKFGFSIAKVIAVYNTFETLPPESYGRNYSYIVDKVNTEHHDRALKLDQEIINFITKKQQEILRKQMKEAITTEYPELLKLIDETITKEGL